MLVELFFLCETCVVGHLLNTGFIGHSFAAVVLFLQHLYFWLFFAKSVLLVKFLQNWRHGCFYTTVVEVVFFRNKGVHGYVFAALVSLVFLCNTGL